MKRAAIILLFILQVALCAAADVDSIGIVRPVSNAYTIAVGDGRLADTYLSPLKYDGLALALDYERRQAMKFDPERWTMRLGGRLEGMNTKNPHRNSTLWDLGLTLRWGMTRRFAMPCGITLAVGGATTLNAGCIYDGSNSNNPVSAKASWTIDATAYGLWSTRIGSLPVTVVYQPVIPVVGAFFSPQYGELYYEIYMGNHSGLAHCAWWGNYFAMENQLTADLHLGATALRIGYRGNLLSTRVNNLNTRIISNSIVIGVSGEWMSVNPRKKMLSTTKIISAL